MAYRFEADEAVQEAIIRCAREQLDHAVGELSDGVGDDPVDAVHSARKAIKKERSLLRLARGAISPQQRRHENQALRQAARSLSGVRDADVMIETVTDLSDRFAGQLPESTFGEIAEQLKRTRETPRGQAAVSALHTDAVQELSAVRRRIDDWQLTDGGWSAIERGLVRSYRQGRKAFARAQGAPSLEDLHSWRKRVKDLWYHERLLAPVCGPAVRGHAKEAHQLADLLGDDHDLGVLRETLTHNQDGPAVDLDAVIGLIDHRRAELQTEAVHIGERVYAEKPKAFRRRMRRCWSAGRAIAGAALAQNPAELAQATRAVHAD
jgi:CHAD domain-containing protein